MEKWTTSFSRHGGVLVPPARRRRRRNRPRDECRDRERQLLRLLRRSADARPVLHAGRGFDSRRLARRRDERRDVAVAVRRPSRRPRHQGSDRVRRVHDHRRVAAGVRRPVGGSATGVLHPDHDVRRGHGQEQLVSEGKLVARLQLGLDVDDGPPQARCVDREGERGPHASAGQDLPGSDRAAASFDAARARTASRRRRIDHRRARAQRVACRQGRDVGRRRVVHRSADRLRQRGEPASRARASAASRDRAATRPGGRARPPLLTAADGDARPRAARWRDGVVRRALGRRSTARRRARPERGAGRTARSAHRSLRARRGDRRRLAHRARADSPGGPRGPHVRPQIRFARRDLPQVSRESRAARVPGRVVGRVARRGRALRAQPQERQRREVGLRRRSCVARRSEHARRDIGQRRGDWPARTPAPRRRRRSPASPT